MIGKHGRFFLFIVSCLFGTEAAEAVAPFAERSEYRNRFMHEVLSVSAYSIAYSDLTSQATVQNPTNTRKPAYGMELAFRVHKIFGITLNGESSDGQSQTSYGLGARAYLPGFFLLGGDLNKLIYGRQTRRFYTYAQVMLEKVAQTSTATTGATEYVTTGFRLGMEFRATYSWSIQAYGGINSLAGNSLVAHYGASLVYGF